MTAQPYTYPHYCERESLAKLMARLDPKQRRVLRSYMQQVQFAPEPLMLKDWLGSEHAVSESVWSKPCRKGGRYYGTEADGNPDFRAAFDAYVTAYLAYELAEEEREVQKAARKYRLAAPEAAEVHIGLMRSSSDDRVRLAAANEVADRASKDTARKGEVATTAGSIDEWRQDAQRRRDQVASMMAAWAQPAAEQDAEQPDTEQGEQ